MAERAQDTAVRDAMKAPEKDLAEVLEVIRLENRWSYRELGEEVGLPESTVRKFIQNAGDMGFHETTVYPIRKYLAAPERKAVNQ